MSMINKILSRLNKREEKLLPGESAVRAADARKNRSKAVLTGGAVLLGISLAAWLSWTWWNSRQKAGAPVSVAQAPAKQISVPQEIPQPVAAPDVASGVEISQPIAASQPVATVTQEAKPEEGAQEMDVAVLSPEPEPEAEVSPPASVPVKPLATAIRKKPRKAASSPAPEAGTAGPGSVPEGGVDKQIKPLSLKQQADNEFRRGNELVVQGHTDEALERYEAALQLDPGHDAARQAMVVLLLENKRNADAERVLQDGLRHNIKHSGFAMLLARIQLERDASWSALLALQKTLPYAEERADYRAFVAALLQRLNRHKEAVAHYQAAVQLSPESGVWWMGLGISLRALQQNEEARAAFNRALETHSLNADLQAFVERQLKEL